ncbi:Ctr copper transporter family-domain-containing protein [Fusarium sp. MPI-SDFR-AT-0072]|uniref:Copper transport protein n=1 Tax=Fusarium oxysporum f. sp. rapae TaxID=485398 RepID=A0A8J5P5S0_FUSOX|nr:Copper transport protein CTR2 [Fusarium oxysporum f. sp. rapae]KAH7172430.1 Ctr copper transporter family-domain-containing protein [Fusarium sp. MPI-SDFR-AT-0072]
MDHAHMDHSGMSHSGMDHGDMDHGHGGGMKDMCSMNMLFTWDATNLCIVFRQWHVRSTTSLFFSLVAVIFLAVGYEALRSLSRQYEEALDNRVRAAPSLDVPVTESTPILAGQSQGQADQRAHLIKAVLYGLQNFYAFMLMLIFMTYNGWVMIAVSLGAFLGYLFFGKRTSATKDNACH